MADNAKLVAWLRERATEQRGNSTDSLVVAAVYAGLADRVERGDFDEEVDRRVEYAIQVTDEDGDIMTYLDPDHYPFRTRAAAEANLATWSQVEGHARAVVARTTMHTPWG